MHACMYVCLIFMSVCIYTHLCIHIYIYAYIYMCIYTYSQMSKLGLNAQPHNATLLCGISFSRTEAPESNPQLRPNDPCSCIAYTSALNGSPYPICGVSLIYIYVCRLKCLHNIPNPTYIYIYKYIYIYIL